MHDQATPRLLNACITGCEPAIKLASNQLSKQKFDYSFPYLLGLEDQFSAMEDGIVHLQLCKYRYPLNLHSVIAPVFRSE